MISVTTSSTIDKFFLNVWSSFASATFRPSTTITIQPGQATLISSKPVRADADLDVESETQWHDIVNTPHVQHGLLRLAAEARRQAFTGEIEEGGFAIE